MEEDKVKIYDVPSKTRNYTIIDNTTGKPINQEDYSLEINPSVIERLKALKKVNEEKVKEAENKVEFEDAGIITAYTPEDPTLFTENKGDDYIDAVDYKEELAPVLIEETGDEAVGIQGEYSRNKILERVKVRNGNETEEEEEVKQNEFSSMFEYKEEEKEEEKEETPNFTYSYQDPSLNPSAGFSENPLQDKIQEEYEETISKKGNKKLLAMLSYIPFLSLIFIWTKNKFLKFHAIEGLQCTLYLLLGGIFLVPYLGIQHEIIKNVTLSETLNTVLLVLSVIGLVMVCASVLTILLGMIIALCGKKKHFPLLWFIKKKKADKKENAEAEKTENTTETAKA